MKNISISIFIHIIFSIAIVAIVSLFSIFITFDNHKHNQILQNRYEIISNSFLAHIEHTPTYEKILDLSKKLNLIKISDDKFKLYILNNAIVTYKKEFQNSRVRVFKISNKHYIYIQSIGFNLMYNIIIPKNRNQTIAFFVLLIIIILILIIYFSLLKKLQPLKKLNNQIEQFSKGNLDIKVDINSKDEIGKLANSFSKAIKNIDELISSKNLFMRNILHELKTPITKGLFLANIIQTDNIKDKKDIINNYNNLNSIINKLANIEKLKTIQIKKENIDIKSLIYDITSILNIDKNNLSLNIDESTIIASKDLFSTVIKNLIENGYKYADDKQVSIDLTKNILSFKSKGDMLEKEFEFYTQAFTQETKNSIGLGLGLYIVNEIVNLHNFKFDYSYKENTNIFSIKLS
ncbi:MAG: ArsS family sensor histidine kinase [Campylobacterota bacterium]|nr:ArsS family sensor histidine kinase [Campylobacterota bacterium]